MTQNHNNCDFRVAMRNPLGLESRPYVAQKNVRIDRIADGREIVPFRVRD
jgi:hypothetical protein